MLAAEYQARHSDTIRGICSVDVKPKTLTVKEQAIIVKPYPRPDEKYWWNRLEQGVHDSLGRHVTELSDSRGTRKMLWPRRSLHEYVRDGLEVSPETVVFGGSLYSHFGYLTLESLARCYFFASQPEFDRLPIVMYGDGDANKDILSIGFVKGILQEVGISSQRIRLARASVRYNTVISLPASFHDEASFSPALGRWMNAAAARVNTQRSKSSVGASGLTLPEKRKAFISRSAITSGSSIAVNAKEADRIMANEGFDVLFPETMSIREQIGIFRQYDLVAGMPSSFFHLKMLSCKNTKCLYLVPNAPDGIASNFLNIDQGLDYNDEYIPFLVGEAERIPKFQRTYSINLDSFRDAVRSMTH